jgi:hypothetical protein
LHKAILGAGGRNKSDAERRKHTQVALIYCVNGLDANRPCVFLLLPVRLVTT